MIVFDGQGTEAGGRIVSAGRGGIEIDLDAPVHRPRTRPALTLATAVPKGPRQSVLVEKCTELGVAVLQPLVARYSVSSVSAHRLDKWRQTAIEAAKQSGQSWLPEIREPASVREIISSAGAFDACVGGVTHDVRVTDTDAASPTMLADVLSTWAASRHVLALVGPEGGWAQEELELLKESSVTFVSLGPNVLRTETAAITFAAAVHAISRGTQVAP